MNERKMNKKRIEETLELCRMLDEDIAAADWFGCSEDTVSYITNSRIFLKDALHDLQLADDEIEKLRLMWRCEKHGGHDPETHCYPCHTENLIKAEAQNAALVAAIQGLMSAATLEEENRAQCAALDLINPLPEGGRDFHALEKR